MSELQQNLKERQAAYSNDMALFYYLQLPNIFSFEHCVIVARLALHNFACFNWYSYIYINATRNWTVLRYAAIPFDQIAIMRAVTQHIFSYNMTEQRHYEIWKTSML